MLFSSIPFLFYFLPAVLLIYFLVPRVLKNTVLLIASLVFYAWGEPKYVILMIATIILFYGCGLAIGKCTQKKWKKFWLTLSVVVSLALLGIFKYADFFVESFNAVTGLSVPLLRLALPIGISFYTFQCLSYTIDVYRGNAEVQKNLISFGAYVALFPQLIAGPIVKYRDVAAQLHVYNHRYNLKQIEDGICLFIAGLAKKVLIADTVSHLWYDIIGYYNGGVLETPGVGLANASTPLVWLGLLAYSLQLYFDFSGYSLMGIGMGKMMGFDFPMNFNFPYISRSITDFWRRWHMTLSGWFKEYVYIPLGGNRKGLKRQIFNMLVVWTLTGIWHGAAWNFVLWGIYYFVLLTIEKIFLLDKLKKGKVWPHIYALFFVAVGWALFVGSEQGVGLGLLFRKLFIPSGGVGVWYFLRNYGIILAVAILCCTPLPLRLYEKIKDNSTLRVSVMGLLLVLCIAYIVASTNSPFLYFRF